MNVRAHLIALTAACLLVIGAALCLLLRFTHGDVAAVLGALTGTLLPLFSIAVYGAWLWEKHPDTRGMSVAEYRAHFRQYAYPVIAPYIVPCLFLHVLATGLWIGAVGTRPVLLVAAYYMVVLAISRMFSSELRARNVALISATLAVSALLGHGVSRLLFPA